MKKSRIALLGAILLIASATWGHAQGPPGNWCGMTPDPAANLVVSNNPPTAALDGINQGRAAEALPPLVPPMNYAQLPDDQKVIVLINLERTARGLSPFDSGSPQLSGNDPVLGYEATNHSALLQRLPGGTTNPNLPAFDPITNPDGGSVLHENSIEGTIGQRFSTLPGSQGANSFGEVIAYGSPEGAVLSWMYQDAGSGWFHRQIILGILACFTNAGAGFAPPIAITNGPNIYTVEFFQNNGTSSGYTPTVISAGALSPNGQQVVSFSAVPTPTQLLGSTDVQLAATFDATVYGLPNDIRQVWIYPTATWGQPTNPTTCPAGTTCPAIMGQLPFGAGAFPCPVTKGTDPSTPSYSCAATVPNGVGRWSSSLWTIMTTRFISTHPPPRSDPRCLVCTATLGREDYIGRVHALKEFPLY